jgi:hypothetical protein
MALPDQLGDREYQKFIETEGGDVALRIGPNAIQDSSGNELNLDTFGRASTRDEAVFTQLKNIQEVLEHIRFQLELITGANLHG